MAENNGGRGARQTARCHVCFRHCELEEGAVGFCGGRIAKNGAVTAYNYGRVTALALDPVEKKPLARFFPGRKILSVGSFGCNLRCPFCQNHEISRPEAARRFARTAEFLSPQALVELAVRAEDRGNIGVAFTYNEPLVGYEYVLDTAGTAKRRGLKTVLVTNGTAELSVLAELQPYIDAMNIDLKGFTEPYYTQVLGGSLNMVKAFIARAVQICHVELTTLIVPGENDSEEEIRSLASWISGLQDTDGSVIGRDIPLHISRFFPRFHMTDRPATDVKTVFHLAEIARESLRYVYTGNC